jgi:glutathione S-transferase
MFENVTRSLYHSTICPHSRLARLILSEKNLEFKLISEKVWEERPEFIDLNAAGTLPVLVESSGLVIPDVYPLVEYLEETYPSHTKLMNGNPAVHVEIRKIITWLKEKFNPEVTQILTYERVLKRFYQQGWADSKRLRAATTNLGHHLTYFTYFLQERDWLASPHLSIADLYLAAHLSVIDFLGYMPWGKFSLIKNWYACIKSRPSFRPLLSDHFSGITPPSNYAHLDF